MASLARFSSDGRFVNDGKQHILYLSWFSYHFLTCHTPPSVSSDSTSINPSHLYPSCSRAFQCSAAKIELDRSLPHFYFLPPAQRPFLWFTNLPHEDRALYIHCKCRSFTVALSAHPVVKIELFVPTLSTPRRRAPRARRDVVMLPSCFVAFVAEIYGTLIVLAVFASKFRAPVRAP